MVAGYAVGGGHVLHVRLRPHDRGRQRPLRPDRPEGRQLRRRLRRRPAGRAGRPEEGQGDLVPLPPVRRRSRRSTMGLVNTVVPLEELEEETVRWCREMLAALAVRAAAAEGELQRGRGRASRHPAARPRRQPALLRQRGGAGGPRRLPREAPAGLREVPASGREPRARLWLAGRAAAHAAGGDRAGARGHGAGAHRGRFRPLAVRRRAGRQRLHPDRHQPLERLLGRPPRRRHRGPARARCASPPAG